ncbi:MAG: virulence RhuM family protein, partial [Gammaproteobacteria bacterium]|nr:virulence RhuM family protein [Gammaproteobacteria bacterium]
LDGFLNLNDRDILDHAGKISHQMAKQLAEQEYTVFKQHRLSDEADEVNRKDLEQLEKLAEGRPKKDE